MIPAILGLVAVITDPRAKAMTEIPRTLPGPRMPDKAVESG